MNNKYRGKHIETGEWVYGYLIGDDAIVGEIVEWDDQYFATETWQLVDPGTVGQITGVKDGENRDIYDGDIIRVNKLTFDSSGSLPENLNVKFHYGMFQLFRGNVPLMGLHLAYIADGEVIGNIHDNSELLAPKEGADTE
ncbi:YopX family protein [Paenibacillus sp. FSL P4-0176]|uniref:YopX family protein n=1 Tax=Paenibacillus sp. FSL P4-0176 TaxID=2921631 RepID=UPI0030D54BF3